MDGEGRQEWNMENRKDCRLQQQRDEMMKGQLIMEKECRKDGKHEWQKRKDSGEGSGGA